MGPLPPLPGRGWRRSEKGVGHRMRREKSKKENMVAGRKREKRKRERERERERHMEQARPRVRKRNEDKNESEVENTFFYSIVIL